MLRELHGKTTDEALNLFVVVLVCILPRRILISLIYLLLTCLKPVVVLEVDVQVEDLLGNLFDVSLPDVEEKASTVEVHPCSVDLLTYVRVLRPARDYSRDEIGPTIIDPRAAPAASHRCCLVEQVVLGVDWQRSSYDAVSLCDQHHHSDTTPRESVVAPPPIVEGASHTSKMLIGGTVQQVLNPSNVFGSLELLKQGCDTNSQVHRGVATSRRSVHRLEK